MQSCDAVLESERAALSMDESEGHEHKHWHVLISKNLYNTMAP